MRTAVASAPVAPTLEVLSRTDLLWYQGRRVHLNPLDASLCADVYSAFCARQSKLYIYPVTSFVLPGAFVAALILNTFARLKNTDRVPKILFYTGIDGRDLFRGLGVGVQCEQIGETFGFVQLNAEGTSTDLRKPSSQALVITGHCVTPKESGYRPEVIVIDGNYFDADRVRELLKVTLKRWPTTLYYVVTSDPLSPLIALSSRNCWHLKDCLREAPHCDSVAPLFGAFDEVAAQLSNAASGIDRKLIVVRDHPSQHWEELRDVLPLAKRHAGSLVTARLFIALTKWLCALPVRPSEFESGRLSSMRSFEDSCSHIKDQAKHEGSTAKLIAGAVSVLKDVYTDLEATNSKREAVLERILEGCYEGKRVAVLLQKPGMRSVLTQTLLMVPEFAEMLDAGNLDVLSVGQLPRALTYDELVVPAVLAARSVWALRASIAPRMTIIAYGTEAALQNWCLREVGLLDIRETLAKGWDAPEGELDSKEHRKDDVTKADAESLLLDLRSLVPEDDDERSAGDATVYDTGPRREIAFEDGTTVRVADFAFLQIIADENEPIKEKRAKDVKRGELVLVTDGSVLRGLFEILRDKVDSQTTLSRSMEVVKSFQRILGSAFAKSQISIEGLHRRLSELGSAIVNASTILEWVEGRRFGPSDELDIQRLGKALDIETFVGRRGELYSSMQRVRVAHRELGRALVRLVRTAYRDADTRSISLTVDGEYVVLYDIIDAIAIKRVVDIKPS